MGSNDAPEQKFEQQPKADVGEPLITRIKEGTSVGAAEDRVQEAQSKMDKRMDDTKLNLSVDEMQKVKDIEKAILTGDANALDSQLKKFIVDPKAGEKVMETVSADLKEVGIDARWSYSTLENRPGYGEGYYLAGREDVGHLSLAKDKGDGTFTSVKFSTDRPPTGINQPIPSVDGRNDSGRNPAPVTASDGLKFIVKS